MNLNKKYIPLFAMMLLQTIFAAILSEPEYAVGMLFLLFGAMLFANWMIFPIWEWTEDEPDIEPHNMDELLAELGFERIWADQSTPAGEHENE